MTEAAEQHEEQEEQPQEKVPETVWDEYDGQHVVLQLKIPYFAVTAPGVPAQVAGEDGIPQFLQLPVMAGILRVKTDKRGDVRITMLLNDPDQEKASKVRADLDPALIAIVTVTPMPQPKSQIVKP